MVNPKALGAQAFFINLLKQNTNAAAQVEGHRSRKSTLRSKTKCRASFTSWYSISRCYYLSVSESAPPAGDFRIRNN